MNVHSYNDAFDLEKNPDAFDEAYMRGALIWKRKPGTDGTGDFGLPRDCQKFYLSAGMADNWATLSDNIDRARALGKRVGFRLTSALHGIPSGWPTVTVQEFGQTRRYVDFRKQDAREKYEAELRRFASKFSDRIDWIDIPYPFCPSNEPGVTEATLLALSGMLLETGKAEYLDAAKWLIDLYTTVFPRRCIGNLGGPTWAAEVLLPYCLERGVMGFRQDSFGYFDYGNGREGENRARLYDQRIAILGGRDKFHRLIFEVTGNGLVQKSEGLRDQSGQGELYPGGTMFGADGEFYQLEATDFGNMGLPAGWITETQKAKAHLAAFYAYANGYEPEPPGDGGTEPPVDPEPSAPIYVEGPSRGIYARILPDVNVDIRNEFLQQHVTFGNQYEVAAFLRKVADSMDT